MVFDHRVVVQGDLGNAVKRMFLCPYSRQQVQGGQPGVRMRSTRSWIRRSTSPSAVRSRPSRISRSRATALVPRWAAAHVNLANCILDCAATDPATTPLVLAMLFLQPGKHAGAGGDVDQLVEEAQRRWAEGEAEGRAARRVLKTGLLAPHPLLIGLLVSLFQAATQINEMTLTFIPKILGVFAALILSGAWIIQLLVNFTRELLQNIPQMVS